MTTTPCLRYAGRPRSVGLTVLAALITLTGCTVTGGVTGGNSSSNTEYSSDAEGTTEITSYTIEQAVRAITLNARAGSVTVTAGEGPVRVTERAVYTDSKPVTAHEVTGGADTLLLREEGCPERSQNARCQVSWEIATPAGTTLNLRNRAGGFELRGMAGEIRAEASTGGVQGRELTSRRVTATTNTGGVELDFVQPPDQVIAETHTGGVEISLPSGTAYAVGADSRKPEIDVQRDPSSQHVIRAKTDTGGIEITSR